MTDTLREAVERLARDWRMGLHAYVTELEAALAAHPAPEPGRCTCGLPGCSDDPDAAGAAAGPERAKVITLCGSTRFKSEFETYNSRLTLEGNVVLSVGVYGHGYHPYHREKYLDPRKPMLDRLHLQKIDMADEIFVIDVGGYIGESTAREIAYAREHGKVIRFLSREHPVCTVCGRDNDNGTHSALERTGHLSHEFAPPSVPAGSDTADERCVTCGAVAGTPEYDDWHDSVNCWARSDDPPSPAPEDERELGEDAFIDTARRVLEGRSVRVSRSSLGRVWDEIQPLLAVHDAALVASAKAFERGRVAKEIAQAIWRDRENVPGDGVKATAAALRANRRAHDIAARAATKEVSDA